MPGKAENIEVSAAVVQRGSVEAQADEPLQDWEQLHKRSVQIGKVFEENSIDMMGDDNVKAGRLIDIEEPITGMSGRYLIKSTSHNVSKGIHRMSLDLEVVLK
jgi:hypothetical protein